MTILLEGISVVVTASVLKQRYPGGVAGFRMDWDNGSWCSDGILCRLSFFEWSDAYCTLMALPDYGLEVSQQLATDVAAFRHGGLPWAPCVWLETSLDADGVWYCWHAQKEEGNRCAVPGYHGSHRTLAEYGELPEAALTARVVREGEVDGVALFRDRVTDRLLAGPRPLPRH